MSSDDKEGLEREANAFFSTGPGSKSESERSRGGGFEGTSRIIMFSIVALFLSPLIFVIVKALHVHGLLRKVMSANLALVTLTIYFVVFTTSTLKPAVDFRALGYEIIQGTGVESPQFSLVALASAWVSVLVVHSYQLLARSIVTWKLFGRGVQISHIASVVDAVSEKKLFSWSTIITWAPSLVGAGADVIVARCFKVWVPRYTPGTASVPAGGMDMYFLIALLVVAFFVEMNCVMVAAMPVTARHLMEWANPSTRTGACGTHAGWSHLVRLVAVYGENEYAHLEFQDKFGSHEVAYNQTWKDLSAFEANEDADKFYGSGSGSGV
ncbi:hypothetical protein BGZ58_003950 [Dissophora ornata]|nr:hypothetical protein BGZ58_003950 [Dissophora ornata]